MSEVHSNNGEVSNTKETSQDKHDIDPNKRIDTSKKSDEFQNSNVDPNKRVSEVSDSKLSQNESGDVDPNKRVEERHDSGKKETESEKGEPIKNKQDGLRREKEVEDELKKKYPEEEGYEILSEVYLRDEEGKIVKDPITGEARRIDFVILKDGEVVDSIEVTSKTADKTEQISKENRIRENGGNYIKDSDGNLIEISPSVQTRIERKD